jgi:predicted transcriptional regulator
MVTLKNGTIDDFFDSALESSKEIDNKSKVNEKHTIWMETEDLLNILKPQRTKLIKYLRNKSKVDYSTLLKELNKSPTSLNKDLEILYKVGLVDILKEPNTGHGIKKVIKPLYENEKLEFKAVV